MSASTDDSRVARVIARFEHLTRADLPRLGEIYTEGALFKDPFNEVEGQAAVQAVFAHMFDALDEPRFVVRDVIVQGDQCLLTWDFLFRFRRYRYELQTVRGASHLRFAADGRIAQHRDYWDAAEELYEKLPAIGVLMRWLKRRASR
ncbi:MULTISPECIES: nuclear transport factor 2 family protein [unclassified Methylibium]|uniref:nuclear transport factor 2 family protein n=1 Tax=unclassified Methylibium TaxID=2633235 RepID=UPI0003F3F401|nr:MULTISPECIES: nuclear transport factor 2 family protein [unclassified Methylibium]EWS55255.1 Ketosteroid isomerase-related protein [Methylibium sp. T29]EWS59516.1 Ketosteroid isomerase-related protein [Methylibium sp. T29-B]